MNTEKGLMVAVTVLAVSLLIGSFWIANSLEQVADSISLSRDQRVGMGMEELAHEIRNLRRDLTNQQEESNYMYVKGAADYLGFTRSGLEKLLGENRIDIPYIIKDGTYIFYKEALDEWLRDIKQEEYHIYTSNDT